MSIASKIETRELNLIITTQAESEQPEMGSISLFCAGSGYSIRE